MRDYGKASSDPGIVRFLPRRCTTTRLAHVVVSAEGGAFVLYDLSPPLFWHLAGRPGLESLEFHKLLVTREVMELHHDATGVPAADAAATSTTQRLSVASAPLCADLKRFATAVAGGAVASLTRCLPTTLTALHLRIFACDAPGGNAGEGLYR